METLSIMFSILAALVLFSILALNIFPSLFQSFNTKESFTSGIDQNSSSISSQIRAVLDPMKGPSDLCILYDSIRKIGVQNEKADSKVSDSEAASRVEKTLAANIPGGALPCPILVYPPSSASDLQWLDFINSLPDDFGARVVFMSMYAKEYLSNQEKNLKDAMDGKSAPAIENFITLCPPDLAQSKRNSNLNASCSLPESLTPSQIADLVKKRLQTLVSTKSKVLSAKNIDPAIDLNPIIKQSMDSKSYLDSVKGNVESGNLVNIPN